MAVNPQSAPSRLQASSSDRLVLCAAHRWISAIRRRMASRSESISAMVTLMLMFLSVLVVVGEVLPPPPEMLGADSV